MQLIRFCSSFISLASWLLLWGRRWEGVGGLPASLGSERCFSGFNFYLEDRFDVNPRDVETPYHCGKLVSDDCSLCNCEKKVLAEVLQASLSPCDSVFAIEGGLSRGGGVHFLCAHRADA